MKFIVKPHPEIFVKSESVRKRFTKILESNIRIIIQNRTESVAVFNRRDHIEVSANSHQYYQQVLEILTTTPGIQQVLEVKQSGFKDLHDIYEQVLDLSRERIENKTFVVRAKRRGKHDFTSIELERYVGGGLNQSVESASVKLHNPDITIKIEVVDDKLNQILAHHKGLGGFPLGTQEDLLSLISGGFDSGVSSYLHIKRGSKVHYCFFNLGGPAHEIGVKQVAHFLWNKYGSSAKVRFISVDFEPVVAEILEKVEDGQMGVVLKRMFMRAAGMVAEKFDIQALVTGEALGQVSSQTLTNLRHIDVVTDRLILRPLINWDKDEIIKVARDIGTEDFAKTMPEYCGVISKKPTVKAVKEKLEAEEANFNFDILEQVVRNARQMDIRDIAKESAQAAPEVEQVQAIEEHAVVLDIRSPDEEDDSPLEIDGVEVKHIPFYKLSTQFGDLDQSKTYLLYCARGVMSRLQALYLQEQGFKNVKVYRP
ncbi:tRNA uracil 4-sulfurtransferase ThiI [Vibrio vulnificus]|jgi:thiamine biosynthesis protein ThiI|uniref:tRNA sulfurtransferase n=1 Tax=Vibrio vulnificus TaxID=672 RepID=A0A1V8MLM5_VIBVL|nr:tRNA uracil 4-sulfurtransferase ThiI [Vibrio vulnificus]ASM95699.1 tRNA s(4)U8 sulfurtransferase [Vibrio vulnificus NBRC 15645 = ATCC 27562]AUL94815.1 tRNA S(4)U 4-thiouridine synthase (former ThiI) / Rhodanese-like domain required for thiamine synthesis [Vibrio vulnificus]AVW99804.1 tRNA 4-thiouridine(8) synthase ThiI [Vibrio vulnificus Env1]EGQ7693766.1 tRNA 4-thiouridine(8) synthase ThiI [Vibrio vulnificus]EGQ7831924.1 tRNA 4-thiouridine(8) synthase ThiI [Vibrio vulnificus]